MLGLEWFIVEDIICEVDVLCVYPPAKFSKCQVGRQGGWLDPAMIGSSTLDDRFTYAWSDVTVDK